MVKKDENLPKMARTSKMSRVPLEMSEPDDEEDNDQPSIDLLHPHQASSNNSHFPSSKKSLLIVGFSGLIGLLIAVLATLLNFDSSSSYGGIEQNSCQTNTKYPKQTLKTLIDRPVASLLKPKNLKG